MSRLRLVATAINAAGLLIHFTHDNFSGDAGTVVSIVGALAVSTGPFILLFDLGWRGGAQPSAGHIVESARRQEDLALRAGRSRRRGVPSEKTAQSRANGLLDRAAGHLLDQAAHSLPDPCRERFAEEWADHRSHHHGWRLLWWALCVRATATRIGRELRQVELPRPER